MIGLPILLAAPHPFRLSDMDRLVSIVDPQISPDGSRIVISVGKEDVPNNRVNRALWLVDVKTGAKRMITHDRRGVGHARWSPDGSTLGFVAADAGSHLQIYMMPMSGGEAEKITDSAQSIQQFAWSPDGKRIAYVAQDPDVEKKGEDKFLNGFEVHENDFLATEAPKKSHVWMMNADGTTPKRLTSGDWTLPVSFPPGPPSSPLSWSADGKTLAIVRSETPYAPEVRQTVQLLDVDSATMKPFTKSTKFEGYPTFSPDGKNICYWFPRDGDPYKYGTVVVQPVAGGQALDAAREFDRMPYRSIWLDSNTLLMGGNDTERVGLWMKPLDGKGVRLDTGSVCPNNSYWVDMTAGPNRSIAFVGSEATHPSELYYMPSPEAKPLRLTDFNDMPDVQMGEVRKVEWKSGNFNINGTITLPPGFDASKKYPVLLYIHGGPNSATLFRFSPQIQAFASHGYVLFEPNYRGSDHLGNDFYASIYNDAGTGPGRDVMAGLAEVKKLPFVDGSKVGISGWSYGGFLTTWLMGHYDGWLAAVSGAPVTDLIDQYTLSDGNVGWGYTMKGSPFVDAQKHWAEESPITAAPHFKTPTLVMCDTGDYRVPISQSYKLYRALQDNHVTSKFVAYPAVGHFVGDLARRKDVFRRWMEWIDSYMGGKAPE